MIEVLKDWGDLIAVHKPAGWLTIPGRGNKDHIPVLSHALGKQLGSPIFVIHRLDQGTSGVVLFARTAPTHREFSMKFEKGDVKKTYHCLVEGSLQNQIVDQPILKLPSKKNRSVVSPKGKASQTVFKNLAQIKWKGLNLSLIEAIPLTGRGHQIRVHLQFLKTPILGDKLYGGKTDEQIDFPLLHAHKLEFLIGDKAQSVECLPSGLFAEIIKMNG